MPLIPFEKYLFPNATNLPFYGHRRGDEQSVASRSFKMQTKHAGRKTYSSGCLLQGNRLLFHEPAADWQADMPQWGALWSPSHSKLHSAHSGPQLNMQLLHYKDPFLQTCHLSTSRIVFLLPLDSPLPFFIHSLPPLILPSRCVLLVLNVNSPVISHCSLSFSLFSPLLYLHPSFTPFVLDYLVVSSWLCLPATG